MKVETVYPLRREDDIAWFDDVMGSFYITPMIIMQHFKRLKDIIKNVNAMHPYKKSHFHLKENGVQ